ncbi:unnamed protein product [Diamesa hyperborea]
MELATFDIFNEAEHLLVNYRNHSTKESNVWIGYSDENHEGVWTSEGGKLLDKNITFHGGEPTNGKGHDYVENCLEIWFSNNEYKFNDNQCNRDYHFICEHKAEISYVDELKANLENQTNEYSMMKSKMNAEMEKLKKENVNFQTELQTLRNSCMKPTKDNCNEKFYQQTRSTEGLEILKENVEIAVTGNHHDDKANEDVIELNISNSKTKFLSNSLFHYFERLRKIQIVKSQLQSLSNGVFSGAEYLRKVFIQGNNIKSINANTFKGADNLNVLNLDNNQIEFVAQEAFDGLEYLTTLILINNKLKEIPANTLNTLYNLMYLELSANEFDKLDGSLLKNNTLLREVWFDRNNIYNIGSELLTYSDKYQRVVFSDNDSEHTCFDTVQHDIIENCSGLDSKDGFNAKEWAKCPPKNDIFDLGIYEKQ